jgi:hypothetical protein
MTLSAVTAALGKKTVSVVAVGAARLGVQFVAVDHVPDALPATFQVHD